MELERRLEQLTRHSSNRLAARACLTLGFVRGFFSGSASNAIVRALEADRLDPQLEAALPLALVAHAIQGETARALEIADTIVGRHDTPLTRNCRARLLARARRLDDAEADLRKVLASQPENLTARIGLAAVGLLREDAARLPEIHRNLETVLQRPELAGSGGLLRDARLLRAVALALDNQSSAAKRILYDLVTDPLAQVDARKALDAIGRN